MKLQLMNPDRYFLVVDDCEEAVPTLEIALEAHFHCTVLHAGDGAEALSILSRAGELPLAILTDLNLPGVDGFELIERVRETHLWSRIPIVVLSANIDPKTPERVRRLGANAFFSKPYSPYGVRQCLERLLHATNEAIPSDADTGGPVRANRE